MPSGARRALPLRALLLLGPAAFFLARGLGGGGALDPCTTALPWRVATVDPRFGLPEEAVEAAVGRAAALWDAAAGRTVFVHDADDGFPIHVLFDERQEEVLERNRRLGELDPVADALLAEQATLQERADRLTRQGLRLEEDARVFTARQAEHNRQVARWNTGTRGSEKERNELLQETASLARIQQDLLGRRASFDRDQSEVLDALRDLQARIDLHNREAEAFDREFAGGLVESGRFVGVTRNGAVVEREIRIYRFDGEDDLTLVLAHELGHALGLGHIQGPRGIMTEVAHADGPSGAALQVTAEDMALLEGLCPAPGDGD